MIIYVMRHGETNWNKEKRLQGSKDVELNEEGIKLAEITSEKMKDIKLDYIFSSPLSRAYKTALIMRRDRKIKIEIDDRLKEMNFGSLEGKNDEDSKEKIKIFFNEPDKYVPSGNGETYQQLLERAKSFVNEVIIPLGQKHSDAKVLILAHGTLNNAIKIYIKGLEIKNIWDGPFPKNCNVTIYKLENNCFTILEENKVYY